jgi:hypothetical protein
MAAWMLRVYDGLLRFFALKMQRKQTKGESQAAERAESTDIKRYLQPSALRLV